jgi:ubiquinone/menaquinone biosynthesis C-methylase UbiE
MIKRSAAVRSRQVRYSTNMDDKKLIEQESRAVFDKLHIAQANDPKIFQRLTTLLSTDYLKVPSDFFKGKICLDAGCGSNANAAYAMLTMGAQKVCAFDLDESILKTAPQKLGDFPQERWELKVGNVHEIPYPDNSFDVVHCAGVLHHSTDIYKGMAELARVLKPGCLLHVSANGTGGIMRDFSNVLRDRYQNDLSFKQLLDDLSGNDLAVLFEYITGAMRAHGDEPELTHAGAEKLFNEDLILTIKDRIQAPLYLETSEKEMKRWLSDNSFKDIERLKLYPKMLNIRRYLAPFYNDYDHPIAKLLYGDGVPRLKAIKK